MKLKDNGIKQQITTTVIKEIPSAQIAGLQ